MRYTNNSSATNSSLLHQKTQTGVLWGLFPSWNSIKQFSVGGGWRARHLVATCVISNICSTVIFLLSLRQDKTHFRCKMCCFSGDHVVSWTQHGGRIYWTWFDYHHNLLEWNHEVVCEVKLKPLGEDITLPTKVHIVKAMIFPVVMYGCESWTKKAECWRRLLRVPWTARRSNQYIHWKDWRWNWSSNTLATWCEKLTHWKRPWCWERLKAGEGNNRGWDGWTASLTR